MFDSNDYYINALPLPHNAPWPDGPPDDDYLAKEQELIDLQVIRKVLQAPQLRAKVVA